MGSFGPLVHVILVSFPGQGHVNPLLRLGKLIASKGLLVTFTTTSITGKQMQKATNLTDEPTPIGAGFIRFEFFDDGWAEEDNRRYLDLELYMKQLEAAGKEAIPEMIKRNSKENRPVSCLINNPFIPWVSDVAESIGLPSAMLWIQSCACFASYYYYYHGLVPFPNDNEPTIDTKIPCMPVLKHDEIPSFLHPKSPYPFLKKAILGQFENLHKPFSILMETFLELEPEIVQHMSKIVPIKTVGPLFKIPNGNKVRGDFIKASDDCIDWLNTKPTSSVVYISFGSIVYLKQEQLEELAHGLLNSGVSFLWVIRPPAPDSDAVYLVDVFKIGVRMSRGYAEDKIITRDEVERCLIEATVGGKAEEMKHNAVKWKEAAETAVAEGGSSDRNIQDFVDEVKRRSVAILAKKSAVAAGDGRIGVDEFVEKSGSEIAELVK
ncbi:hypothetical protein ACFE04_003717 [Oxalis oulophora]